MAKVKAGFRKTFLWEGEEIELIVLLDVADDDEGYGVVFGDDTTDRTVAFGQGDLSFALADKLWASIVNELESYPEKTELSKIKLEHDELESLYDCESGILPNHSYFKELQKIINYIDKWYKE